MCKWIKRLFRNKDNDYIIERYNQLKKQQEEFDKYVDQHIEDSAFKLFEEWLINKKDYYTYVLDWASVTIIYEISNVDTAKYLNENINTLIRFKLESLKDYYLKNENQTILD